MRWVYLSPHLDDIVLSCGGMVWQQVQAGEQVDIWTFFSGDVPPGDLPAFAQEIQARWGTGREASAVRRAEDAAACRVLGAAYRHLDYPDCIYRRLPDGSPLIVDNDALFQPPHPAEQPLIEALTRRLAQELPRRCRLVSPLSIGGHVDHRMLRAAAEGLGRSLYFYADYPYLVTKSVRLRDWIRKGWRSYRCPVSPAGLQAWQDAVACHVSQISTFWGGTDEMRADIAAYSRVGGDRLWLRRKTHIQF